MSRIGLPSIDRLTGMPSDVVATAMEAMGNPSGSGGD